MNPKSGHAIAWSSFLLGIVVSVLGNIAHATSDAWTPAEVIGSGFWPLALMLSVEILTRVRWVSGKAWTLARFAGLVLVAVVAFVLSYRHLAGLMTGWGEDTLNAHLGPLAVDGLMLLAATALLSISKAQADVEPVVEQQDTIIATDVEIIEDEQGIKAVGVLAKAKPVVTETIEDVAGPDLSIGEKVEQPPASRLHVVDSVSESVSEEAVRQAFLESGGKMSAAQVASQLGVSKSTAHRRYTSQWAQQIGERRIQR